MVMEIELGSDGWQNKGIGINCSALWDPLIKPQTQNYLAITDELLGTPYGMAS